MSMLLIEIMMKLDGVKALLDLLQPRILQKNQRERDHLEEMDLSKDQTNQDNHKLRKKKSQVDQRLLEGLKRMMTLKNLDGVKATLRELKPLPKRRPNLVHLNSDQINQKNPEDLVSEVLGTTQRKWKIRTRKRKSD